MNLADLKGRLIMNILDMADPEGLAEAGIKPVSILLSGVKE